MKKRWPLRALSLVLLLLVLNATVSLAADAGSSGDPLVTLSYLNDTYLSTILNRVDPKITSRNTTSVSRLTRRSPRAAARAPAPPHLPPLSW